VGICHARRRLESSAEAGFGVGRVRLRDACTSGHSCGRPFVVRSLTVEVAGVSVLRARYRECFGVEWEGGEAIAVLYGVGGGAEEGRLSGGGWTERGWVN
jgi:hypothetical protein